MDSSVYTDKRIPLEEFLARKERKNIPSGIRVNIEDLNHALFPFQQFCVQKALLFGRYALFEECGLGKTLQQVEWAHHVVKHTGKPVLILAPLAVASQTIAQAKQYLNYEVAEYDLFPTNITPGIYITNYEQIDNVDFSQFSGVVLDESSILKNFEGKIKKKLIEYTAHILYKLCCTA